MEGITWGQESTTTTTTITEGKVRASRSNFFFTLSAFTAFDSGVMFHRTASRDSAACSTRRPLRVSVSFSAVTFFQPTAQKFVAFRRHLIDPPRHHCHLCKLLQGHGPIDPGRWETITRQSPPGSHTLSFSQRSHLLGDAHTHSDMPTSRALLYLIKGSSSDDLKSIPRALTFAFPP